MAGDAVGEDLNEGDGLDLNVGEGGVDLNTGEGVDLNSGEGDE